MMVEHASAHRGVVRLKGGDPLVFGRACEEIAALTEAGVPFEIVPGITAAFAAAAAIGCSLTSRNSASSVSFSTGHHAQSRPRAPLSQPENPLLQLEDSTRVVYMPGRDLRPLARQWLDEGLPWDFPCAVVSRAAQPDQQVQFTTLAGLGEAAPAQAPSLLIAGWALRESAAAVHPAGDGVAATA
jgi:siroheme synthase